jgi:putative membrane-bound dehydrogenase-like protein
MRQAAFGGPFVLLSLLLGGLGAVAPPARRDLMPGGPLTPAQERATFAVPKGFIVELVACEPAVVDPVAMAFDEDGRIFVAEMRAYPNAGVGTGIITSGRIKLLEDADGDGYYEKSTVFADGLRLPTGVMPYKGGLLVANAPDLLYLKDGRRTTLYTGFNLANIQQLVNSLQWALDNHVHGCAGGYGGTIRSAQRPGAPPVTLRGRGIRFQPDVPGSLEPTSGGGQYGLTPDAWERWFTATNSQHLRHIVLPDHYLRREPALAVGAVTLDIPDHGAACRVYRRSPFERWRVERTTRRKGGPDARRFPRTELVPGGYITSACSPLVYAADLFEAPYCGNVFVCDPANNLIHRDVLVPHGATFTARRAEDEKSCEFLSSTDNWFRPVHLSLGPDGAIYVLDFYRPVIETPLSLPDDIKKRLDLETQGKGRIWRIRPAGVRVDRRHRKPALGKAATRALVGHLADANLWWRLTAQRLLVERQDRTAVEPLRELARTAKLAPARAHALWTLDGLRALPEGLILAALKDPEPGVREQALRLADDRLAGSAPLRAAVVKLADDPAPRLRFQLACTLGACATPEATAALVKLARHPGTDRWTQTAILSSAGPRAVELLEALAGDGAFTKGARLAFLSRLAALVGARATDAELARALALLGRPGKETEAWQLALLDGLAQGLRNSARPLGRLWERPPEALKESVARARTLFARAAATARDSKRPVAERVAALALLGRGPFAPLAATAPALLTPAAPPELQLAAVRALGGQESPAVAGLLLAGWGAYSPAVRREAVEALFARSDRLPPLLTALEKKRVLASQVEPLRLEQLRRHPSARIRARARKVLAGQAAPERARVVAAYRPALALKGRRAAGKALFAKHCATCHRLEGVGHEVGPDLLSALRNKSAEQLLSDLLDPSREVDPRYLNYLVRTKRGQQLSGMIAAETASSITLRRGEKAEDVVLRRQVEKVEATGKSLMPEGLEAQLTKQDVADLIAYLQAVAR